VWNATDSTFAKLVPGELTSARPLATVMHATWASFIRTGVPITTPEWPTYDTNRRATFLFDRQSSVVDDPAGDLRGLWP
jgi:para-nitrobenzyl esterase